MAEPQGHLADVAGGLKHHHRAAVAKLMGRHGAVHQRGTFGGTGTSMLIENVFEPGPCHRGAFGVDEDLWDASGPAYRQPCPEVGGGLFPKRKGPFLAALSDDTDARGPLQRE